MIKNLAFSLLLLVGLSFTSAAFTRSYYAEHSRLASGTWVKVKTPESGMYQLTYKQLREMGFTNPARVQVYGYPAVCDLLTNTFSTSQPDDLVPVATRHTGEKILFYGVGDCDVYAISSGRTSGNLQRTRTPYDTGSYYFLSDSEAPVAVPERTRLNPTTSSLRVFDSHLSVVFREEDTRNEAEGGVIFHGNTLTPGQTSTYTFDIHGYAPLNRIPGFSDGSGAEITLHNRVGFRSPSVQMTPATYSCDDAFTISGVNDNGCYPTAALISFRSVNQIVQVLPTDYSDPDADYPEKLTISITQPSTSQEYLAEDYQALVYPRRNTLNADTPQLLMTAPQRCISRHQMFFPAAKAGEMEVWNITNPYKVDKYVLTETARYHDDGGVLVTMDAAGQRMVAFMPAAQFPSPQVMGKVEAQDLHGVATPDMVIIATAPLLAAAERLAELHRQYQGLDVAVVDHNAVYNEFSSGARSPMAYRRFLKMLHDRDNRLKYVLFMGQANYDNRGVVSGTDPTDRLVLWAQDDENDAANLALNYALDTRIGMLQDDYTTRYVPPLYPIQVAVGRLPLSADEVPGYLAKAERWFTNPVPPEVVNNVLAIGGSGDACVHLEHAQQILDTMAMANPRLNLRPLHSEMYPGDNNEYVRRALEEGVGFFEYSGHGSKVTIENWTLADTKNVSYTYPVIAMISSCDQFAIDHDQLSFVNSMLANPDGGAIVAVAASRGVYIIHNQRSAVPFSLGYATARPGQTVGDVYREQYNKYVEGQPELPSTGYKNMLSFNFGGDPAMPINVPAGGVTITSVNGTAVGSGTVVDVKPYQATRIAGMVTDASGACDKAFNGTVKLTVYDAPRLTSTYNTQGVAEYKSHQIADNSVVLAYQIVDVEGGLFEAEMVMPASAYAVASNRLIATAVAQSGATALGSCNPLAVASEAVADSKLEALGEPEVLSMEITVDPASAFNPEGAKAVIHAVVNPSQAGLEMRNSQVNSASSLAIDGRIRVGSLRQYITASEDGEYTLEIPVTGLSEGVHSACLTIVSASGKSTVNSLDFTVIREQLTPALIVNEGAVTTEATFDLDTPCEYVQLEVTAADGSTVHTADNVKLPYKWNLKGKDGATVSDGRYDVVARVRNGAVYGSAKNSIVVLK